jgi:HEAT repeat protein
MKRTLWLAAAVALALPASAQDNDPDRRKSSTALFADGLRAETHLQPPNLPLAITKYKKAIAKAKDEKNNEIAAQAGVRLAWCYEKLEPENISDAKAAYDDVVANFKDVKPWGDIALEGVTYKGVDVWLKQLHKALDPWRVTPDRSPLSPLVVDKKAAAWDKIKPLDKEAVPGLLWGLGHADEVIRTFSAECLGEVVDEPGIAAVIAKLNEPAARAGASAAFQKIYKKWNDARELDRRASELDRDLEEPPKHERKPGAPDPNVQHAKLKEEANKLRAKANEIRHNIPANLATPEIQGALEKIIADEGAHAQARREAAQAASWIGQISGPLVDALIKGMQSKDRNVREACVRAGGAVDTNLSADKHKIADELIKLVQYEPARVEDKSTADWPNDEAVRQAAAEALEHIALVKSLPALIEALDDNDARVRHAAFRALREITRRDFDYENDDKGLPKTYEPDKPLAERKKAQAKWEEWWKSTAGVVVLVERFWRFQSQWKDVSAVKLFDPEMYLKEVESRKWTVSDPQADLDRAKRVSDEFQRRKDVFVQDAVDIGAEALDQLLKFIGGETEREPKANPATRTFVAQACARIIEKHNVSTGVEKLREALLQGDTPAKKAGAAAALGFLPKASVQASERQALQERGLGAAEPEVKEAAATALAKVGEESSAADLTKASLDSDVTVQIAALRALSLIAPKNPDTVKTLGEMVGDEPEVGGAATRKSKDKTVREWAARALGAIGDPAAMKDLLRSRRDEMRNVREATIIAVRAISQKELKAASEECFKVLMDERRKTEDRIGAALSLGDMGDAAIGKNLSERLIDPNPPRVLREPDPGVRIKIAEALGNLGAAGKVKSVVERLLSSMADEQEREHVRDAAYSALKLVTGIDPDSEGSADAAKKFKASDPKPNRDGAIKSWMEWFNAEGKTLSDPG